MSAGAEGTAEAAVPPTRAAWKREVLPPERTSEVVNALGHVTDMPVWVYRYRHAELPWTLSIATGAPPGSGKLSLGGFRIAPAERADAPGYDNDREAIGLAIGMEEKVRWSRLLRVGGPLARRDADSLVGGKCVLLPTADARVGQPRDRELLDFALAALQDAEATAGIHITTGQDLGHGLLSDGRTTSLAYMHERFDGCTISDTGKPTAEGNVQVLRGMLRALDLPVNRARVGLIGCGNIGSYVRKAMSTAGAETFVLESSAKRREEIASWGVEVFAPEDKAEFLAEPMDALVVNAGGGSLDAATCEAIAASPRTRIVCGCENLAMPDPHGADVLRAGGTMWCPTELGGMMGYLTAVEEYRSRKAGAPFDVGVMFAAAARLEIVARDAARAVRESGFERSFEDAVRRDARTRRWPDE